MVSVARSLVEPVVAVLSDPELDPLQKLQSAVETLTDILNANRERISGYVVSLAAGTHNESVREQILLMHRELTGALARSIGEQKERGQVPGWTDPEATAELMVALANGVALRVALEPDGSDPAAVASQFARMLVAAGRSGLGGEGGGSV